jgi:hypothetical protein
VNRAFLRPAGFAFISLQYGGQYYMFSAYCHLKNSAFVPIGA